MGGECSVPGRIAVDGLTVGCAHVCLALAAHVCIARAGTPERRISGFAVRHACAAVVAQCCVLFGLLLCEIAGVMRHSTRWTLWHAELAAMVFVILVVIPVLQIALVLLPSTKDTGGISRLGVRMRSLCVLIACFALYAVLFWRIGSTLSISRRAAFAQWPEVWRLLRSRPPVSTLWSNETLHTFLALLLEEAVGRVGVLGVAIVAGVSAFGAASGPYSCWNGSRRASLGREIADMEARLAHVSALIERKAAEIDAESATKASPAQSHALGEPSPKKRLPSPALSETSARDDMSALSTPLLHQRLFYLSARSSAQLSSESQPQSQLQSLRDLQADIKSDLRSLRRELAAEDAAPLLHRAATSRAAGLALAVYGVATAARSASNVVWGAAESDDAAATAVRMAAHYLRYDGSPAAMRLWTRAASLCIATGAMASSMYALWPIAQRVLRRALPASHGDVAALGLAQVLGAYFVGSVLVLRASIPRACGGLVAEGLSDIRLEMYAPLFDGTYAVCFVLATVALYAITPV